MCPCYSTVAEVCGWVGVGSVCGWGMLCMCVGGVCCVCVWVGGWMQVCMHVHILKYVYFTRHVMFLCGQVLA